MMSHPTWVRGLKQKIPFGRTEGRRSHPTWVRGLKQARIEYARLVALSHPTWVRGLKLVYSVRTINAKQSHPTWVRGLKQPDRGEAQGMEHVAPYVGAWIETDC